MKAFQLAHERYGGLGGTVSVRTKRAIAPALRKRFQLADGERLVNIPVRGFYLCGPSMCSWFPHRVGPWGDLCARRIGEGGGAPKKSPSLLPCRAQM